MEQTLRDDLRLAREIDQGDRRAFERFLDAYGGRVHALVRRAIPNPSDAEDVTQEIFVDLFKCMGKFRGDSALSTWVYRIAMNHCLKHRSRMKPDSLELDESMEQESDWRSNPLLSATKNELKGQVSQALEQLTPLHRDVIVLHDQVAPCEGVDAVCRGPDPLGELLVRLIHAQRGRRDARSRSADSRGRRRARPWRSRRPRAGAGR